MRMPKKLPSTRTARSTRSKNAAVEKVDRLSTLPPELFAIIIALVADEPKQLARVCLVSKQFYAESVPKLYNHAERMYAPSRGHRVKDSLEHKKCAIWKTMHDVPSLGAHVHKVDLVFVNVIQKERARLCRAVKEDLKLCINLKELQLPQDCPMSFDSDVAEAIARAGLATTTVRLRWTYSGPGVTALLRTLPHLQTLILELGVLRVIDWPAPPPLSELALQTFEIDPILHLPKLHFLAIVISSLPTLRSITLQSSLLLALSNRPLPALRRIRLILDSEGIASDGADLLKALHQCPSLETLIIESPKRFVWPRRDLGDDIFLHSPPLNLLLGLPHSIQLLDLSLSGAKAETVIRFISMGATGSELPVKCLTPTMSYSDAKRLREVVDVEEGNLLQQMGGKSHEWEDTRDEGFDGL